MQNGEPSVKKNLPIRVRQGLSFNEENEPVNTEIDGFDHDFSLGGDSFKNYNQLSANFLNSLSSQLVSLVDNLKLVSGADVTKRLQIMNKLKELVAEVVMRDNTSTDEKFDSNVTMKIFGSLATGLSLADGDVDVCIFHHNKFDYIKGEPLLRKSDFLSFFDFKAPYDNYLFHYLSECPLPLCDVSKLRGRTRRLCSIDSKNINEVERSDDRELKSVLDSTTIQSDSVNHKNLEHDILRNYSKLLNFISDLRDKRNSSEQSKACFVNSNIISYKKVLGKKNIEMIRYLLKRLARKLERTNSEFFDVKLILFAKVPIVKCTHRETRISLDITFDQMSCLTTTLFIIEQMGKYSDLRPIIIFLKKFLKSKNLADPQTGGIGSYLLFMMCLAHIKNLHRLSDAVDKSLRPLNIGYILHTFFYYYGVELDYKEYGISVGESLNFLKSSRGWVYKGKENFLAVENPLDKTIDLGRNTTKILESKKEFANAYDIFCRYDRKISALLNEQNSGGIKKDPYNNAISTVLDELVTKKPKRFKRRFYS